MPWGKRTENGRVCVYKKTTGKTLHCYSGANADDKANKYLAALHSHMPESEKEELDILKSLEPKKVIVTKAGNMAGLAKHLSKKLGGDPHFFSKCMGDESVANYDEAARSEVCARAHKIAAGIWPGEHGGENPSGMKQITRSKKQLSFHFNPNLMKEAKTGIVIDNELDDDWMKTLPGYKDEVEIHKKLAAAHAVEHYDGEVKVVVKEDKKIIAMRGASMFLVEKGGKAVVVNIQTKQVSKPMNKDAYLKFGYWEAYTGEQNTSVLELV